MRQLLRRWHTKLQVSVQPFSADGLVGLGCEVCGLGVGLGSTGFRVRGMIVRCDGEFFDKDVHLGIRRYSCLEGVGVALCACKGCDAIKVKQGLLLLRNVLRNSC